MATATEIPTSIHDRLRPAHLAWSVLALQVPLAILAIDRNWAGNLGGSGDASSDWASDGTALTGPVLPQVILNIGATLGLRGGRAGAAGLVVTTIIGVLMIFNSVRANFVEPAGATTEAVMAVATVILAGFGAGLAVLGVRELLERRAGQAAQPSPAARR